MGTKGTITAAATALSLLTATGASAVEIGDTGIELYGRIDVSLQASDEAGVSQTEVKSNASRFGIKGSTELSDSLELIYQLEWEVDPVDEGKTSNDHIKSRNQFIGLRGGFGEVLAGRHDTPLKTAQKKVDLFSDWEPDLKRVFNGEVRADNVIRYSSPAIGDAVTVRVALVQLEDPVTGNDGLADATSMSIEYGRDDLYLALAMDSDAEGLGVDTTRLVGQYQLDAMQFGLMWQSTDVGAVDEDGFLASFAYKSGSNTFKLQHGDADIWMTGEGGGMESQTTIGLDHKLGESTKLYTFYSTGDIGGTNLSNDYIVVGLQHKF